jgi:hypothetical protein
MSATLHATGTRFPHRQTVAQWLQASAQAGDPPGLRRLLPLVQARLDGVQRLDLHRALWAAWAAAGEGERFEARQRHDGRYAGWCTWMALPLTAPLTVHRLATAHLCDGETVPELQFVPPRDPEYVGALLAEAGVDLSAPRWALPALKAGLMRAPGVSAGASPAMSQAAMDAVVARAMEGATAPRPVLIALGFAVAVHHADAAAATRWLVRGLSEGRPVPWPRDALLRWIEGAEGAQLPMDRLPLLLQPALQRDWLRPERLHDPAWRATLAATLARPALRRRLQALEAALPQPLRADPAQAVPRGPAWTALRSLDTVYARALDGALPLPACRALLDGGALADPARAALARLMALRHFDLGELQAAAGALAQARAAGCPQAAGWLAGLLRRLAPVPTRALADALAAGHADAAADGDEHRAWQALEADPAVPTPVAALAMAMLARLATEGRLAPTAARRRCDPAQALPRWRALAAVPELAAEARAALEGGLLAHAAPWFVPRGTDGAPMDHLWVPPRRPVPAGATARLWIVPSCVLDAHRWSHLRGLIGALPQDTLLFVNNPDGNWYGDAAFDALAALVRQRVLPRFRPEQVCCYYGSMGGHAALKLALAFGFQALVFNPQTDLDLWAAFRPGERERLWSVQRHGSLDDTAVWRDTPTWIACGADTADREAFSWLVRLWQHAPHARLLLQKVDDPAHAGLIARLGTPAATLIRQRADRLQAMRAADAPPADATPVPAAATGAFWSQVDAARTLSLEVWVQDGRVAHRPLAGEP